MTHLRTPPSPSPSSREDAGTYAGTYARTYAGIVVLHLAPGGCRRVMLWVAGSLRAASLVVTADAVQHEAVGAACAGEVVPCSQLSAAALACVDASTVVCAVRCLWYRAAVALYRTATR
jgi:hypothetical protein